MVALRDCRISVEKDSRVDAAVEVWGSPSPPIVSVADVPSVSSDGEESVAEYLPGLSSKNVWTAMENEAGRICHRPAWVSS